MPHMFWDPSGLPGVSEEYTEEREQLNQSYAAQASRSMQQAMFERLFLMVVAVVGILVMIFNLGLPAIPLSILLCLGLSLYEAQRRDQRENYIRQAVAVSQGWAYSPSYSYRRKQILSGCLPEIFGYPIEEREDLTSLEIEQNRTSSIGGEMWGEYIYAGQTFSFWNGHYSQFRLSFPWGLSSEDAVFAFRLPTENRFNFALHCQAWYMSPWLSLRGREINLESNDFNRYFYFNYKGIRSDREQRIFNELNPAVMAAILDMREAYGPFDMELRDDTLALRFHGNPLSLEPALEGGYNDTQAAQLFNSQLETLIKQGESIVSAFD